ncbi:LRR receptor-like kinase resistance protein, partial [Trifolium pratense]
RYFNLEDNNFFGKIPQEFATMNRFDGSLPANMFNNLPNLQVFSVGGLYLSQNLLSGSLPDKFGHLQNIVGIDVSNNCLSGEIPRTVGKCISLEYLLLNGNAFNGSIPSSLESLKEYFNVSFNMLEGEVPIEGVFKNASALSMIGNNKLCGGILELHLPPCSIEVYKGTLESIGGVVAIKVLNLEKKGAHKSFIAEYYNGNEFKALVFEYMRNGNLESWLHPATEITDQSKSLNLEQRLNIITDVASAFHYLHYECEQPVIHCDLKPANVLINDFLVAQVSDFGLARLLSSVGVSLMQNSTTGIKGTVGYAPLEYGMGSEVSIEGNMYSFGILVLEMLTGKRPTDEMFKDDHNLHNYVKLSIPDHLFQIVDRSILAIELEDYNTDNEIVGGIHPNWNYQKKE